MVHLPGGSRARPIAQASQARNQVADTQYLQCTDLVYIYYIYQYTVKPAGKKPNILHTRVQYGKKLIEETSVICSHVYRAHNITS
jgi:hypothetical protein